MNIYVFEILLEIFAMLHFLKISITTTSDDTSLRFKLKFSKFCFAFFCDFNRLNLRTTVGFNN